MPKATLLSLEQAAAALNLREEEVVDLCRRKQIPHRIEDDGQYTFPDWEIKKAILPRPSMPEARKVDLSGLTKAEIVEVFQKLLAIKAQEEEKEEPAEPEQATEKEEPQEMTESPDVKEAPQEEPRKPAAKKKPTKSK